VFAEVSGRGEEMDLFKKIYKVEIGGAAELPRSFILSSKGKLIKDLPGVVPYEQLKGALLEGIEQTGGFKGPEGVKRRLEAAYKELEAVRTQVGTEATRIEGLMALVKLEKAYKGIPQIKKEIKTTLATFDRDPAQKPLLLQARMLVNAEDLAVTKKTKKAIELYQLIVKTYPDSEGAKLAEQKVSELQSAEAASAESKEAKPAEGDS
jgi:hypothetical protein